LIVNNAGFFGNQVQKVSKNYGAANVNHSEVMTFQKKKVEK